MLRRELYQAIGGLDEAYVMYSEELDYCRRAKAAGWQVAYHGGAIITHHGGKSSEQVAAQTLIHFHTSKLRYFRKHHGFVHYVILRSILLLQFAWQLALEAVKGALGHKRGLRARARPSVLASPSKRVEGEVMRIGLISGEFPPMPGGVGDFTRILAENTQARGHDVHVLSRAGANHQQLPVSTMSGWGAGCLLPTRRWARHNGLDIVNLQYQTAAYDMSPFIHFLPDVIGVPVVTTFHDLRHPYLFPKAGRLRDWIVMRLARASRGVIATNREDEESLQSVSKRRMIPIGSSIKRSALTTSERAVYRRRLGAEDSLLLGHFGFVRPIKGVDYLIEALARIRSSGKSVQLVFIGERSNTVDGGADCGYLLALDEKIRRYDLEDAVHATGFLPDDEVSAWLGAVDLVVLPYLDGASFRRSSLIAALHQGCAIIATEPATVEPAFAHGNNLWLTPPRSSAAIEDAVMHLLSQPQLIETLRAGAEQVSKEFDWQQITRNTIAFFESCL